MLSDHKIGLNCLVWGSTPNQVFVIMVTGTDTVYSLKELIKQRRANTFRDVEVDDLDLYRVSVHTGIGFSENLRNLILDPRMSLDPATPLSEVFTDIPPRTLHIIVKPPVSKIYTVPSFPAGQYLELNCLILGDDPSGIFVVQIANTAHVVNLKAAIKHQNPGLGAVDDHAVTLYKVSMSKEDVEEIFSSSPLDCKLHPLTQLSNVFPDPPLEAHLHIIVAIPLAVLPRECFTSLDSRLVVAKRLRYVNTNGPKPPSSAGRASEFAILQNDPEKAIFCSRPPSAEATIPVTLLHPVFGEFLDSCQTYKTTAEDNKFTMELSAAMSLFYRDEEERANAIRSVFAEYGIHFIRTRVGIHQYKTDGDISQNGYRYAIAEFNNEVGSTGAEPYSQAGLCYLEATRTEALKLPGSVLPCFIVLVFGPYIAFAGAAWTERPTLQALSTPLALYYHHTDDENRIRVARHIGALKKAIRSLGEYYQPLTYTHTSSSSSLPMRTQLYPYQTHFTSRADQKLQAFEYTSQPFADRLIFFGKLPNNDKICVKFVRRYSVEAHSLCASMGRAPTLRGFEQIAGGWFMVVMDTLPEHFVPFSETILRLRPSLQEEIEAVFTQLHQQGYVHGDVRDTNIRVLPDDTEGFMLLDFDWAGEAGKVRYPANVNRDESQGLWRPEGAVDGQFILVDHDIEMLKKVFTPHTL